MGQYSQGISTRTCRCTVSLFLFIAGAASAQSDTTTLCEWRVPGVIPSVYVGREFIYYIGNDANGGRALTALGLADSTLKWTVPQCYGGWFANAVNRDYVCTHQSNETCLYTANGTKLFGVGENGVTIQSTESRNYFFLQPLEGDRDRTIDILNVHGVPTGVNIHCEDLNWRAIGSYENRLMILENSLQTGRRAATVDVTTGEQIGECELPTSQSAVPSPPVEADVRLSSSLGSVFLMWGDCRYMINRDGTLLWDTCTNMHSLVGDACFSPDGTMLARIERDTGGPTNLNIVSVRDGQVLASTTLPDSSGDGRYLLIPSFGTGVVNWTDDNIQIRMHLSILQQRFRSIHTLCYNVTVGDSILVAYARTLPYFYQSMELDGNRIGVTVRPGTDSTTITTFIER